MSIVSGFNQVDARWTGPIGSKGFWSGAEASVTTGVTTETLSEALEAARENAKGIPDSKKTKKMKKTHDALRTIGQALTRSGAESAPASAKFAAPTWPYSPGLRRYLVARELAHRLKIVEHGGAFRCIDIASGLTLATLTPPTQRELAVGLQEVVACAGKRNERRNEILSQVHGAHLFFMAQCAVAPHRQARTIELAAVVTTVLESVIHPLKHLMAVERPERYKRVAPMVETPDSYAYPGGHAAFAFGLALLLHRLSGNPSDVDGLMELLVLANRIGENRVIAGLHYPKDTESGMLLGLCITQWLVQLGQPPAEKSRMLSLSGEFTVASGARLTPHDACDLPGCEMWQQMFESALVEWNPAPFDRMRAAPEAEVLVARQSSGKNAADRGQHRGALDKAANRR